MHQKVLLQEGTATASLFQTCEAKAQLLHFLFITFNIIIDVIITM